MLRIHKRRPLSFHHLGLALSLVSAEWLNHTLPLFPVAGWDGQDCQFLKMMLRMLLVHYGLVR